MSTPNFSIQNQAFMLDELQTELFFDNFKDMKQANISSMNYPVFVVEKFNTAEVVLCPGYYYGSTLDYTYKNEKEFNVDDFLEFDLKEYARYCRKKINQLTKVDWLKAIGEYFFNNLYFLSDYNINLFKCVKFTHRNKKDFVYDILSKILDYDIERAEKRLYELADEYGAEEIICIGRFSSGEAIYQKKAS